MSVNEDTKNLASAPKQKTVVLGITGCIAAYKACEIVRALQKVGVRVLVVMTQSACEFVNPLTFRALTHELPAQTLFDSPTDPIPHISLAHSADALLIAPCTANVIAKIACGIADDLLTTVALATKAPILFAPAMNVDMYENSATCTNITTLKSRGVRIIEAQEGYLACGDVGRGRLADIDCIVNAVLETLFPKNDLAGKHVMITAGPTVEPIDPVRYLSNYSSGKTGYALARAAQRRGAEVELISGPVSLASPLGVRTVFVKTACEMFDAARKAFDRADIAIFSAAVADVRPKEIAENKLKKTAENSPLNVIELVENPDILATLGANKSHQVVVGFAAETQDVIKNAREKLITKHANFMVANMVGENLGFNTCGNKVWFVDDKKTEEMPYMSKDALADAILDKALKFLA